MTQEPIPRSVTFCANRFSVRPACSLHQPEGYRGDEDEQERAKMLALPDRQHRVAEQEDEVDHRHRHDQQRDLNWPGWNSALRPLLTDHSAESASAPRLRSPGRRGGTIAA